MASWHRKPRNWYEEQRQKREFARRNRELGIPEPPPEVPLTAIYSRSFSRGSRGQRYYGPPDSADGRS